MFKTFPRSFVEFGLRGGLAKLANFGNEAVPRPTLGERRRMPATKMSSGVAPVPREDETRADQKKEMWRSEKEVVPQYSSAILTGQYDNYDGIIVDPSSLPADVPTFLDYLSASIALWKKEKKQGIWLQLPIENVNLVAPAVEAGFRYHHAEPGYVMLTLWLPDRPCTLPPNASHQVGVGAFVLNDKNEILAVQEKNGILKGTGVWKMPTGLTNQGEDIFAGAIREVKEETGVDTEFVEVVGFRQGHQVAFAKSDLFFICVLRPLSTNIVIQESEIAAAQWMPLAEFGKQAFFTERKVMQRMLHICRATAEGHYRGFECRQMHASSEHRAASYLYYNAVDLDDFDC